jgi:hypothetical protein
LGGNTMKPLQHRFPQQSLVTVALLLALLGHRST